jgi:GTP-binding protein HflX
MKEQAILISANLHDEANFDQLMEELENLVFACDLDMAQHMVQNIKSISAATYIGQGKVEEVRMAIEAQKAEVVVFNHELSATQHRNLEKALQTPVLDRTALILEIFRKRAKTRESVLQVELAEMQYLLPRLAGSYSALGRQGGGVGTKNKGVGEKKIDLDKRRAEEKIYELKIQLNQIQQERQTQRKKRKESHEPVVALVGYTNAGKSTTLNAFLSAQHAHLEKAVFEKDMLFATLDTSVRRITLPNKRKIFISDTVGFVSNLPHGLVKAFGSTLEEVTQADLLLHIIDVSNPDYKLQMEVTESTLKEIGASDVPIISVFNKADLVYENLPFENEDGIYVSAKRGIGLELIGKKITELLFGDEISCELHIPYTDGASVHHISENASIISRINGDEGTLLHINCSKELYEKYKDYAVSAQFDDSPIFKPYEHLKDYARVSAFLKRIYRPGLENTNWLEARWEYMHYHPNLNVEVLPKIGLWEVDGEIVGMANPEHNFGDVYLSIDPSHPEIKRAMLEYAQENLLRQEGETESLRVFISESDIGLKGLAASMGYSKSEAYQQYRGMSWFASELLPVQIDLPAGYRLVRLDEAYELAKIDRVLWRGFDHEGEPSGDLTDRQLMHSAPNFKKDMTFVVEAPDGQYASFSGIWLDEVNQTAYIEPVATDPLHRRKGLGKAAVLACIQRCADLGATTFYVGSGQQFYYAIGFEHLGYTYPWSKG